jgi:hypothetical protein
MLRARARPDRARRSLLWRHAHHPCRYGLARVAALVYIAALAPDADETSQGQQDKFPKTEVFQHIEVTDGRIWLEEKRPRLLLRRLVCS